MVIKKLPSVTSLVLIFTVLLALSMFFIKNNYRAVSTEVPQSLRSEEWLAMYEEGFKNRSPEKIGSFVRVGFSGGPTRAIYEGSSELSGRYTYNGEGPAYFGPYFLLFTTDDLVSPDLEAPHRILSIRNQEDFLIAANLGVDSFPQGVCQISGRATIQAKNFNLLLAEIAGFSSVEFEKSIDISPPDTFEKCPQ